MAYDLTEVYDAALLRERQYIRGVPEVLFSNFTSCIGVVVRTGASLTAVHLVQIAEDHFDRIAAQRVLDVLGNGHDEACILGCVNDWAGSQSDNIRSGYQHLVAQLATLRTVQIYRNNEGYHGVAITGDRIQVSTHWVGPKKESRFLPIEN